MIACYEVWVNRHPFGRIVNAPSRNAAMEMVREYGRRRDLIPPGQTVVLKQYDGEADFGPLTITNCLFAWSDKPPAYPP